jgi:hypothetical protein
LTKICPKCKTKNLDNANFCEKCGDELPNTITKKISTSKGTTANFKDWWDKQTSGVKAITLIGGCCVGLLLIIFIVGFLSPDNNLTEITIDGDVVDVTGESHIDIDNDTTEYVIKGSTESNATINVTAESMDVIDKPLKLGANNTFEFRVKIPKKVSEVKVVFFATKPNKTDSTIEVTLRKPSATETETTETEPQDTNYNSYNRNGLKFQYLKEWNIDEEGSNWVRFQTPGGQCRVWLYDTVDSPVEIASFTESFTVGSRTVKYMTDGNTNSYVLRENGKDLFIIGMVGEEMEVKKIMGTAKF